MTIQNQGPSPRREFITRPMVHSHPVQLSNYLEQQFIDGAAKAFDSLMACLQTEDLVIEKMGDRLV
jgi:hypothetical protein